MKKKTRPDDCITCANGGDATPLYTDGRGTCGTELDAVSATSTDAAGEAQMPPRLLSEVGRVSVDALEQVENLVLTDGRHMTLKVILDPEEASRWMKVG